MSKTAQAELPLFQESPKSENVEWFVGWLERRDWTTAAMVLQLIGRPVTENEKRKLRAYADASEGRICGHQKGYKLTTEMTHEEYTWWRNEALKIKNAIEARVVETDRVFYRR